MTGCGGETWVIFESKKQTSRGEDMARISIILLFIRPTLLAGSVQHASSSSVVISWCVVLGAMFGLGSGPEEPSAAAQQVPWRPSFAQALGPFGNQRQEVDYFKMSFHASSGVGGLFKPG